MSRANEDNQEFDFLLENNNETDSNDSASIELELESNAPNNGDDAFNFNANLEESATVDLAPTFESESENASNFFDNVTEETTTRQTDAQKRKDGREEKEPVKKQQSDNGVPKKTTDSRQPLDAATFALVGTTVILALGVVVANVMLAMKIEENLPLFLACFNMLGAILVLGPIYLLRAKKQNRVALSLFDVGLWLGEAVVAIGAMFATAYLAKEYGVVSIVVAAEIGGALLVKVLWPFIAGPRQFKNKNVPATKKSKNRRAFAK